MTFHGLWETNAYAEGKHHELFPDVKSLFFIWGALPEAESIEYILLVKFIKLYY